MICVAPYGITNSISAFVWVVSFCVNAAIGNDELKCIVHKAAIAAFVIGPVTVYQFLL